jgi:TP901 family phage tail tape measure protein
MADDTAALALRVDNGRYISGMRNAKAATTGLAASGKRLTGVLKLLATGFVAVKVKSFTTESIALSRRLAEVNTLLGVSAEEMRGLREEILDLSREMGFLSSDAVPALYQAISASIPKENVIDFLKVSGRAAVGGVTNLETAVDGLTTVINAYGLASEDAALVSDLFFETVKRGKTTFPELSQGIGMVAPIAKAAGVRMEELFGAIASLTKQGLRTPIAMTALRGTLTALLAPSKELGELLDQLRDAGVDVELGSAGLINVLQSISNAVDGDTKKMAELIPNVRGLNGVLALLSKNAEGTKEDIDAMTKSAGAASKAFLTMKDDVSTSANQISAAWEQVKISIGDVVVNSGLLEWIREAMGLAQEFGIRIKASFKTIGKVIEFTTSPVITFGKNVVKTISWVGDNWKSIWANMSDVVMFSLTAIGDFFSRAWDKIIAFIEDPSLEAAEALRKSLSPTQLGQDIVDGIAEGAAIPDLVLDRAMGMDELVNDIADINMKAAVDVENLWNDAFQKVVEDSKKTAEQVGRALPGAAEVGAGAGAAVSDRPSPNLAAAMAQGSAEAFRTIFQTQQRRGPEAETAKNTAETNKLLGAAVKVLEEGLKKAKPLNLGA